MKGQTQKLSDSKKEVNKFETKYFFPDKKREKTIVFLVLLLTSIIVLAILTAFSKNNNSQVPTPTPKIAGKVKNTLKPEKVKVSDESSETEKKDINVNQDGEIIITLIREEPTTSWQLIGPFDQDVISLEQIKFKSMNQYIPLSKPKEEWIFKSIKEGKTEINVSMKDIHGKTLKTENFKIIVRKI